MTDLVFETLLSNLRVVRDLARKMAALSYDEVIYHGFDSLIKLYTNAYDVLEEELFEIDIDLCGPFELELIPSPKELKKFSNPNDVVNLILVGSEAAITLLNSITKPISVEMENKLQGYREQITKIEIPDPDMEKNIESAITEFEHGHYLASGLISARIVDYIVSKFEGKTIDEKIKGLVEKGLIDKKREDVIKDLTHSAKLARNFVSHNIHIYPDPNDAMKLLGSAVTLIEIYCKLKKTDEDKL